MTSPRINTGAFCCLLLACIASASGQTQDIRPATMPANLLTDLTPADIVSMRPADRRDTARGLGRRLIGIQQNNPTRAVVIRLTNAAVSYDSLSRRQRSEVEASLPPDAPRTRPRMRALYENALADILARSLAFTDRQAPEGRYGVYGLPVETVLGSYDLGTACNARYEEVIGLMDVFVSARSFILYGSNSTEWDTARRGLRESIRLRRDDQPLMFRTNGMWRIAYDGSSSDEGNGGGGGRRGQRDRPTINTQDPIDAGRLLSRKELRDLRKSHTPKPAAREFAFHWNVTGDYASSIDTSALPVEHDTVIFYQYMLGALPRIIRGRVFYGGAPQLGDMELHLSRLEGNIAQLIPDPEWDGYAVIDYEAWPTKWEILAEPIKEVSREYVRENNPGWSRNEVEARAKIEFEDGAREFLLATIRRCKEIRPNAKWGYYLGHQFFASAKPLSNLDWLWEETDAFYPSAYAARFSVDGRPVNEWQARLDHYEALIGKRVFDLREHIGPEKPILAYIYWNYINWNERYGSQPLNDIDLDTAIFAPARMGADGIMIWESLREQERADAFQEYLNNEMGPRMIDLMEDQ